MIGGNEECEGTVGFDNVQPPRRCGGHDFDPRVDLHSDRLIPLIRVNANARRRRNVLGGASVRLPACSEETHADGRSVVPIPRGVCRHAELIRLVKNFLEHGFSPHRESERGQMDRTVARKILTYNSLPFRIIFGTRGF